MPSSALILDQVVALVEPLTRFDRSSITLADASDLLLSCTGTWSSSVTFSSSTSDGTGKLPSDVRNAASSSGMENAIQQALASERSRAVQRIRDWCDAQTDRHPSTHKPLTSNVCFSGATRVGYTWRCSTCRGEGKTQCTRCHGHRQIDCSHCGGRGKTTCTQCHGTTQITCSSCGGRGGWNKQVEKKYFNTATNQYSVTYEQVWEHCFRCQRGQIHCVSCHGGSNLCMLCHSGKVTCPTCTGNGTVTCSSCKGEGILHRIAQTACKVTNTFAVRSSAAAEDVQHTLAQWDFPLFCALADVDSDPPAISPSELVRRYPATIKLSQAHLHCAGQRLMLSGYGPKARVFDFKGIVGHLLADDLRQLEATLSYPLGFLPFRNQAAVGAALSTMLASELNQQLCDSTQRKALISNSTVTEQHAGSTAGALRKAMGRLYRSFVLPAVLAVSGIAVLTLQLLYNTGYMLPANRPQAAAIFLAVVVAAAFAADFFSRRLMLKKFFRSDPAGLEAARRLLDATGTLRRWRIACLVSVIASTVAFFAIITS